MIRRPTVRRAHLEIEQLESRVALSLSGITSGLASTPNNHTIYDNLASASTPTGGVRAVAYAEYATRDASSISYIEALIYTLSSVPNPTAPLLISGGKNVFDSRPDVAIGAFGIVVVWTRQTTTGSEVDGAMFSLTGTLQKRFTVPSSSTVTKDANVAASPTTGNFVVTYTVGSSTTQVVAELYSANGAAMTNVIVSSSGAKADSQSTVVPALENSIYVAYVTVAQAGQDPSVAVKKFDGAGKNLGSFTISGHALSLPKISADDHDAGVVAYVAKVSSSYQVYTTRFQGLTTGSTKIFGLTYDLFIRPSVSMQPTEYFISATTPLSVAKSYVLAYDTRQSFGGTGGTFSFETVEVTGSDKITFVAEAVHSPGNTYKNTNGFYAPTVLMYGIDGSYDVLYAIDANYSGGLHDVIAYSQGKLSV